MAKRNWSVDDWKKVLSLDECPFELIQSSNRQNDRIWAKDSSRVQPMETIKFPPKFMVWGMMSHQALSELHFVEPKQTVNTSYYVEEILSKTCDFAMKRKGKTGSILKVQMLKNMSKYIFIQDGAPSHTASKTQQWCSDHLKRFWEKTEWPGNSPDLNPIENLWSILKGKVNELEPVTKINELRKRVESAWGEINPQILENLTSSTETP